MCGDTAVDMPPDCLPPFTQTLDIIAVVHLDYGKPECGTRFVPPRGMVTLRLALTPLPGKAPEIIQTVVAIATQVRTHRGCLEFVHFVRDEGRSVEVVLEWSDRAAADTYLRSREHRALIGAAETLCRHHTLIIHS